MVLLQQMIKTVDPHADLGTSGASGKGVDGILGAKTAKWLEAHGISEATTPDKMEAAMEKLTAQYKEAYNKQHTKQPLEGKEGYLTPEVRKALLTEHQAEVAAKTKHDAELAEKAAADRAPIGPKPLQEAPVVFNPTTGKTEPLVTNTQPQFDFNANHAMLKQIGLTFANSNVTHSTPIDTTLGNTLPSGQSLPKTHSPSNGTDGLGGR